MNGPKVRSGNSYSLKHKLKIAFTLMSIFPLLVCIVLISNYRLYPQTAFGLEINIAAVVAISVIIALIGFLLLKGIFDRIVSVSSEAKLIAAGDLNRQIEIGQPDEVGDLSGVLNQLTQRIRENMNELKDYGERTTQINLDIQKRVLMLSSLLQISSLISQGLKLDDVLKTTVAKSRLLGDSDIAYLFFREEMQETFSLRISDGADFEHLLQVKLRGADHAFVELINKLRPLVLDKNNALAGEKADTFYRSFKLKNTLALPVFLRGRVVAILGIGNNKDCYVYSSDEVELLDILSKQVAIALENDILVHRVEKLEIKDALTGLYNKSFIGMRLQEEIKRAIAYQRPCAFIVLDIDNFNRYHQKFGALQAEATLKQVATLIRDSVSDIDRAARTGDNEFSIVLPEKNKRTAQDTAEMIRRKIEFAYNEEQDPEKKVTISAGVSENPLDGIVAQELIDKAGERLGLAKRRGRNCVIG